MAKLPDWFAREWQNTGYRCSRTVGVGVETRRQTWRRRLLDHWLLYGVASERLEITQGGRSVVVGPGELCLCRPRMQVRVHQHEVDWGARRLEIMFLSVLQSPLHRDPLMALQVPATVKFRDTRRFRRLVEELASVTTGFQARTPGDRIIADRILQDLLAEFALAGFASGSLQLAAAWSAPPWLLNVRRHIETRFKSASLRVDDIARFAGYSTAHLQRAFRAWFGEGPMQYLQRYRAMIACRLFRSDPEARVTEIAARCGIRNRSQFSRHFSHHVGMSPGAFRDAPKDKTSSRGT
jgi:AraC-like DNA-binding protein